MRGVGPLANPRAAGLAISLIWLVGVSAVGLMAQATADAGSSALIVQAAAVGIAALVLIGVARGPGVRSGLVVAAGIALVVCLAPMLVGPDVEGVRRWLRLGPVLVQPAALMLPFVLWSWASERAGALGAALVGALAAVLAVQPDAGSATGLLGGLIVTALARRGATRREWTAMAVAALAALVAWMQPDPLPAVAHVERVLASAFAAQMGIGVLAALGLVAVIAPFAIRAVSGGEGRAPQVALAGLFGGLVLANLLGNFPAPVIGGGASLLIGWALALGLSARAR